MKIFVTGATGFIGSAVTKEHFGWMAMFAAIDRPASSEWTRDTTGWAPREEGLIETMRNAGYFDAPSY